MGNSTRVGCVHGRFQIFHNEHLEYVLEAMKRCDHLLVGLTKFDASITITHEADAHRSERQNNPLSYYERALLIRSVVLEAGIPGDRFEICPFPIDHPEDIENFVGKEVVCYTTIRDEWNREKIDRLRRMGYSVEVVIEGEKSIAATDVRRLIAEGSEDWRRLVPPATAKFVDERDIANRLRSY